MSSVRAAPGAPRQRAGSSRLAPPRLGAVLLGLCAVLTLLWAPAGRATDSCVNIERRKEKLDRLQDLLRISEAELKLEQLRLDFSDMDNPSWALEGRYVIR